MRTLQAIDSLQHIGNVNIQSQDSRNFPLLQSGSADGVNNQSEDKLVVDINQSSQEFIPGVHVRADALRSQNSSNLSSQVHLFDQLKHNSQSLTSFYSTINKDARRHRRLRSTLADEQLKTFDAAGSHTKWLYGLRGCQVKHVPAMN